MCFSQDFLSRSFTVDLGSAFGFSDVLTSRSACHWIPLHLANTNTMILPLPRFGNPHFSTIIWSIFFTSLGQWTVSHLTGSNRFNYETVTATMYGVCDFDVWYFGWDLSLTSPLAMSLRYVFIRFSDSLMSHAHRKLRRKLQLLWLINSTPKLAHRTNKIGHPCFGSQ